MSSAGQSRAAAWSARQQPWRGPAPRRY